LKQLEQEEDTDKDKKITKDDNADKVFMLETLERK
jgi:hypothetical protein